MPRLPKSDLTIEFLKTLLGYLLHRLAYLYMTGNWPLGEIHHVNHNPSDNRWANLADVTPLENNRLRRCRMTFDTIGA